MPARVRRTAVGAGVLLLALTACTGQDAGPSPGPSVGPSAEPTLSTRATAASAPASGDASASGAPRTLPSGDPVVRVAPSTSVAPAADPGHTVPAPATLTTRLYGHDILVYSPRTLSAATIAAIAGVDGVRRVESMAMAQVSVQGKAINVAAVDPATYRRFTPPASAQLTAVWDRIAGGEIAVRPGLRDRLGERRGAGYVRLGNNSSAPDLHVGAYAPQVPQVDAVVNTTWVRTLGMRPDNALVLWTGITSPQRVRARVERLAGADASVQLLGPDLDISVQQTAFLAGSVAQAVGTFNYSVLGGGRIAPDPAWVASHIVTEPVPILGDVTCNKAVFPQLRAALDEIVARGLADEIHPQQYAGCYNPRFIAGTTSLSNHSFGLALDLNTPGNQRGTVGDMDRSVVSVFEHWGFTWGGRWQYTDPMHFEMNALINPR